MSRLDTLPVGIIRTIFQMACPCARFSEASFWLEATGTQDEQFGRHENCPVRDLEFDELSSSHVRRIASEQQHYGRVLWDLDSVKFTTTKLQEDPALGRCVRVVELRDLAKDAKTLSAVQRPIRDFLETVSGLTMLTCASLGMAALDMGNENPLTLHRLHSMRLDEYHYNGFSEVKSEPAVLDMDGTMVRMAPNLRFFSTACLATVVGPKGVESSSLRLKRLKTLVVQESTMSSASLQRLLSHIGPDLQTVRGSLPRRSLQLSDSPSDSGFTFYDLLVALAPWKTKTLKELTLFDFQSYRPADDEGNIEDEDGPSAMSLLSGFTSLTHAEFIYELFDWRGAGPYSAGYLEYAQSRRKGTVDNDDQSVGVGSDNGDDDGDEDDGDDDDELRIAGSAARIARVARRIVDQLPPNLERLKVDMSRHYSRMYFYTFAWEPRRLAFQKALLAAIRSGQFPHLSSIQLYGCDDAGSVKYEVSIKTGDNSTSTRTITICGLDVARGSNIDSYERVSEGFAYRCDDIMRYMAGRFMELTEDD